MLVNGIVAAHPTVGSEGSDPNFLVDKNLNKFVDQGGNFITWKGLPFPPPSSSMYLEHEEFFTVGADTKTTDIITSNIASIFPNVAFGSPQIDPLQPTGLNNFEFAHGPGQGNSLNIGLLDYDGLVSSGVDTGTLWFIVKGTDATDEELFEFQGGIGSRLLKVTMTQQTTSDWRIMISSFGGIPATSTQTPTISFPDDEYFIVAINCTGVGNAYTSSINGIALPAFSGGDPTAGTWFHSAKLIDTGGQSKYGYSTDGLNNAILCMGVTTEVLSTTRLQEMISFANT